jgi:hypothetical protein
VLGASPAFFGWSRSEPEHEPATGGEGEVIDKRTGQVSPAPPPLFSESTTKSLTKLGILGRIRDLTFHGPNPDLEADLAYPFRAPVNADTELLPIDRIRHLSDSLAPHLVSERPSSKMRAWFEKEFQ